MRVLNAAIISLALTTGFCEALAQSAPPEHATVSKPTKEGIVGAWRLVRIDYSGPDGERADPVFGPDPQGVIIYDRSGWMSVQIVTANRPAMARPATRTSGGATPDDAKIAAAAFDTYYAYFGTWEFDADTAVVTHHIKSSLLPYETGLEYRRDATLDGNYLKLSVRPQEKGGARQRTLVWARVPDAGVIAAALAAAPPRGLATKYGNMPVDYQEAIGKYFLEHLKYPESVQYQAITQPEQGYTTAIVGGILMRETREYGWKVKATINAKDSHEAYVGFKTYTFLFRGEKIVDTRVPLRGGETN